MMPLHLRALLTQLFVVMFAATALLHPPMMARDARPAMDCHFTETAQAVHAAHGDHAAPPAAPSLDCPLSTLPPLPAMSEPQDRRVATPWRYAERASAPLHTAKPSPAEPPPRIVG